MSTCSIAGHLAARLLFLSNQPGTWSKHDDMHDRTAFNLPPLMIAAAREEGDHVVDTEARSVFERIDIPAAARQNRTMVNGLACPMVSLAILLLTASSACTRKNPKTCVDGVCVDTELPFCDVGGEVSDSPNTCIAVECSPSTFEVCRSDEAIVCNSDGTNFDVIPCSLGCEAGVGCRMCKGNGDCQNSQICDTDTFQCRGCKRDSECNSNACDSENGVCLPSESVIYVSSTGLVNAPCTMGAPCQLAAAIDKAPVGQMSWIRMLPGTYTQAISTANKRLTILGSGALHRGAASNAVLIGVGAEVEIRDLEFDLAQGPLSCRGASSSTRPRLVLRRTDIRAGVNPVQLFDCVAKFSEVTIRAVGGNSIFGAARNSTIEIDRSRFKGLGGNNYTYFTLTEFGALSDGSDSAPVAGTITNSIFEDLNVGFVFYGSGSVVRIFHNTFVMKDQTNSGGIFLCDQAVAGGAVQLSNNVIYAPNRTAVAGTFCEVTNNLISPQISVGSGNKYEDPAFVSVPDSDYRLTVDSPAVDAAAQSTFSPSHDFLGKPRPVGPAYDIGAHEYAP